MNKVKKFEISVVDRTYSKIVSNLVKFYSSDSALEVIFILAEKGYEFDSAELVLSNADGSLITRPLSEVSEGYSYEFEKNIISHHGEWKGQVVLTSGSDTYVSSKIVITIEDDLLGERPPKLTDVYSWTSLKRYADGLVAELKQAVLKVEGMDDIFNANELERQVTFESNESERNQTFESNEDIRQSQELERETAESTRQTVFDGNEDTRTEAFNTNEAARKANEEARELAENERENAEAQRKIDHEFRSAELDGKADKVVLKNLVVNGDFSKGLDGWDFTGMRTQPSVTEGKAHISIPTNTGSTMWPNFRQPSRNIPGNKTYYYFEITDLQTNITTQARLQDRVKNIIRFNKNGVYSVIEIPEVHETNNNLYLNHTLQTGEYLEYKIDNIMMIDLTQTFGVGNEPTKEEMDELIKVTGYIYGEYALNNKEFLIWTLALIRRNKNAIITLGGTI